MSNLSTKEWAYIAGFLDGDGSVYAKLKPNETYKYDFQIAVQITFFQSTKKRERLETLLSLIERGYLRDRNDGITEYIIGDIDSIRFVLTNTLAHLRFKNQQAELMLQILEKKGEVQSAHDFLDLAQLVDNFRELNYSKKRTQTAETVKEKLEEKQLLTP